MFIRSFSLTVLLLISLITIGQEFYFSTSQFEFAVEPKNKENTKLTDSGFIYGLCVLDNVSLEDIVSVREYPGFVEGFFKPRITVKGTKIYDKEITATAIEKGGKVYMYFGILPNPEDNLDETAGTWERIWNGMPEGINNVRLFSKEDIKFKIDFQVEKSGEKSSEDIDDLFYKAERSATDFFNNVEERQKEIEDRKSGLSEQFADAFSRLYHEHDFVDPTLSLENIENLLASKQGGEVRLLKVATRRRGADWSVKQNALGEPIYQSTPHFLVVFEDVKRNWCFYRGALVVKDHLGGGNYGAPYIEWETQGIISGRCGCENVD